MLNRPNDNRQNSIDLPSLPVALARIIEITSSADATADDVAAAVLLDQSLTTKVLRMANSAYYARMSKADTVSQAVVTLGFSTINNLAVASSVVDNLFPSNSVPGFGWKEFWVHSVTCGAAAEVMWVQLGGSRAQAESAFIAGLLHDVGKLIIARAISSRFVDVVNCCQIQRCEMVEAENAILYTTHAHIGLDLGKQWNFPDTLCAGIAYHHHSAANPNLPDVARVVKAGNMLAKALAPNYILDVDPEIVIGDVAATARLDPLQMDNVIHQVEIRMSQCEELLSWGNTLPRSVPAVRRAA